MRQIACARRAAATITAIAGAPVAIIPRSTPPSIAAVQNGALLAKNYRCSRPRDQGCAPACDLPAWRCPIV